MMERAPSYIGISLDLFDLADKGASSMQIIQADTIFMMTMDESGLNFNNYDDAPPEDKAKVWENAVPRLKQVLGEPMFRRFFPPQTPDGQKPA